MLIPDNGYFFGMGVFETIGVEEGKPILLAEHYRRLETGAGFLGISLQMEQIQEEVCKILEQPRMKAGRKVIKITASEKNYLVTTRENPYSQSDYQTGFSADFSSVRRNETSPFTYHKTLNYGDCLMEKQKAKARGISEPVFLNMKGAIVEGATSNVFFIREKKLYTPKTSCGLLPGVVRDYICRRYQVEECEIFPKQAGEFEEMFLTNSLLGVMPVTSLGRTRFSSKETGWRLYKEYQVFCKNGS